MMSNRRSGRIALALWKWALLERCVDRKPRLNQGNSRNHRPESGITTKGASRLRPTADNAPGVQGSATPISRRRPADSSLVVGRESTVARTRELRLLGTAPALSPLWYEPRALRAAYFTRTRRAQFRAFMQNWHSERLTTCIRCWASRAALTSL